MHTDDTELEPSLLCSYQTILSFVCLISLHVPVLRFEKRYFFLGGGGGGCLVLAKEYWQEDENF